MRVGPDGGRAVRPAEVGDEDVRDGGELGGVGPGDPEDPGTFVGQCLGRRQPDHPPPGAGDHRRAPVQPQLHPDPAVRHVPPHPMMGRVRPGNDQFRPV
ncbi:hypothetical protein LQ327_30550 [Actinomycetospora endophytica]|uniref:Uncharacterized protein n=1 Tax=Actinomycetospora endophytica TaxID=2291215 RepID=A0ABS8PHS5_9PSEU|nr:hypothetical protein [Actinomycetospora endophytica]MCD2197719.1 hypothetical protein [Actinomycetospora endophytica]